MGILDWFSQFDFWIFSTPIGTPIITITPKVWSTKVQPADKTTLITKGMWEFVFNGSFSSTKKLSKVIKGKAEGKTFDITGFKVDLEKNETKIYVRVKENPIPAFIIAGAIIIALASALLVTLSLTLKEVNKVVASPVIIIAVVVAVILLLPKLKQTVKGVL